MRRSGLCYASFYLLKSCVKYVGVKCGMVCSVYTVYIMYIPTMTLGLGQQESANVCYSLFHLARLDFVTMLD